VQACPRKERLDVWSLSSCHSGDRRRHRLRRRRRPVLGGRIRRRAPRHRGRIFPCGYRVAPFRLWHIAPTRAVAVTSVVSLVDIAIHWFTFGFERMIGLGLAENLLQLALQGVFAGAGATYLFTRSVVLLGAGRAAVFPSLVPGFTLLIGFLALGEVPSLAQLAGFAIVLAGFRLTQRN
jgi:drug/metabolite transporter (DMT)-like permease